MLGEVGGFGKGTNAWRDQILSKLVELDAQHVPLAVFAFERLQAHVRTPVYRESPGYCKCLAAAWDVTQIGFWVEIDESQSGTVN